MILIDKSNLKFISIQDDLIKFRCKDFLSYL